MFGLVGWLIKKWYVAHEAIIDGRAYRWRMESPILSLGVVLAVGAVVGAMFAALIWYGAIAKRPPSHRLIFAMLRTSEPVPVGTTIQIDFSLVNSSQPPDEIHNIFGQLWIDAEFVTATSIRPTSGHIGSGRLQWDIQIPVFPKGSSFATSSIRLTVPPSGREISIGAQFVSKETEKQEYMWRMVNEAGASKFITVKNADADLK